LHKTISIDDALKMDDPLYIDMRSPSEFHTGHVYGAINIPLFEDDERAEVGTIYKNIGVEEAKIRGLAIASSKLPQIINQICQISKNKNTVIIYCWRGGMRSRSVVTILELLGSSVYQLVGGYKAYRRHVLDSLQSFSLKPKIVVLCGSTGVGKTTLLKLLDEKDIPVIDLEKLANHRGSAFGQVGLGQPETAQNFDANILQELERHNNKPYIVVECESKRVGNVYLPEVLYNAMQKGIKILVHASVETRINRLIEEYTDLYDSNRDAIIASLRVLSKRLGVNKTEYLVDAFSNGRISEVVHVLLVDYYDPLYGYEKSDPSAYDFIVDAENLEQASCLITSYLKKLGR